MKLNTILFAIATLLAVFAISYGVFHFQLFFDRFAAVAASAAVALVAKLAIHKIWNGTVGEFIPKRDFVITAVIALVAYFILK